LWKYQIAKKLRVLQKIGRVQSCGLLLSTHTKLQTAHPVISHTYLEECCGATPRRVVPLWSLGALRFKVNNV